ncbi:phosphotransferase [uncultured Agrococcus sp.]|uniref:phosphotransferase family protein n=1 Tax=uncultured Agrococcus sp. TaxID=382258 RepID=UPI0025E267FB|nr:phosphotransferase [uncultured Agrococcus sp.]
MTTLEADYPEPDEDATIALVEQLLRDAGHYRSLEQWQWVRSGSSSLVVIAGDAAVRVARDVDSASEIQRAQRLVDSLPPLTFSVPRSLAPARSLAGVTAIAVERVAGEPHPAEPADPRILRSLLDEIHDIPLDSLRPYLASARAFFGGADWYDVMQQRVIPALPESVRQIAQRRTDALATLETPKLALNHTDLGGTNIHWSAGRVVGVLDWDLACEEDPAEDLAALANWHGWQLAGQLADADTVRRAAVFRDLFPMMVVAFALLRNRPEHEVQRTVERASRKLMQ